MPIPSEKFQQILDQCRSRKGFKQLTVERHAAFGESNLISISSFIYSVEYIEGTLLIEYKHPEDGEMVTKIIPWAEIRSITFSDTIDPDQPFPNT